MFPFKRFKLLAETIVLYLLLREAAKKKTFFLGNLSQMWVGGVADSQTRSKPLKTPPNCPENRLFRPKFHLSFSQISQKPWSGWVGKQIWERYPKKKRFFLAASLTVTFYFYSHLTSQLHGASLLYVDFILLVTWEWRTRHWGDFLHGIMFVLLIYFEWIW